ncbi:MAG: hypothetical protein DCC49_11000 [Acidobacteria bacterium]|nr:MAG: hypothetical protein DCC49_11000 [Acidobacteriota bacterium]
MSDSNSEKEIEIEIGLGAVKLPLEDLLFLRPGGELEFSRPEELYVTLGLQGCLWANGRLRLEGDRIKISLTRVFGRP